MNKDTFENNSLYFWLIEGEPQSVHFAFLAHSKEQVNFFYEKAIELGGKDNGRPGYREYGSDYYATYIIDLDGNNVEVVFHEK